MSGIGIEVDHSAKTGWVERVDCDFCGAVIQDRSKLGMGLDGKVHDPSARMTLEAWTSFAEEPKFLAHACDACAPVIQDLLLSKMKAPPTGIQYLIVPGCETCEGSGFVPVAESGTAFFHDLGPCLKCGAKGYRRQDVDAALKAALEKEST